MLTPKPNGSIHLCIDLTKLNVATKCELYHLGSNTEMLAISGENFAVMSKLDKNSGCWKIVLDEESQHKCTFITPSR